MDRHELREAYEATKHERDFYAVSLAHDLAAWRRAKTGRAFVARLPAVDRFIEADAAFEDAYRAYLGPAD